MLKQIFLVAAAAAFIPFAGDTLAVGDKVPANKFSEVIWSWDGAESLSDYIGEPILVDFWGKNCPPCIGSAVPHAIKLYDKFSEQGLHVLLVESQAHGRDEIMGFMSQYWTGHVPMGVLGTNAPFQLPGNTIPKGALIGVDGSIVWTGAGGEGCEKVLDEQLSKLHQIKALDGPLKGFAKDLNARNFGKVAAGVRPIIEKPANDKVKADAEALLAHLTKSVDARFGMAKRLADAGRASKAIDSLKSLAKQVNGDKEWSDKVAAQIKEIETGSKDDLAADKIVTEAEGLIKDKAGRAAAIGKLADVLKKYPSAKDAKYAADIKGALENKAAMK